MTTQRQIGTHKIDLTRVRGYHYDMDGNLIVTFHDTTTMSLAPDLADDFLAHWNMHTVHAAPKSKPVPPPPLQDIANDDDTAETILRDYHARSTSSPPPVSV